MKVDIITITKFKMTHNNVDFRKFIENKASNKLKLIR